MRMFSISFCACTCVRLCVRVFNTDEKVDLRALACRNHYFFFKHPSEQCLFNTRVLQNYSSSIGLKSLRKQFVFIARL